MRVLVLPAVLLPALLLAGCDSSVGYVGYRMDEYFPFDGERTWEFTSTDTTLPYKLVATLDPEPETEGGVEIFSIQYDRVCVSADETCTDARVRTVRWSSDAIGGTRIWGYENDAGAVSFDPPVQLTLPQMVPSETATTQLDGVTWTSTFVGVEACPVTWTSEWEDRCLHLHLDDGDGDATQGSWLAGDYWAIVQYNVVGMALTEDTGTWQLSYATYSAN